MNKQVKQVTVVIWAAILLLVTAQSCSKDEPPVAPPPSPIVKDTITVSVESVTHRSVTLRVQNTVHSSQSSIKLLRVFNDINEAIADYPLETADTTITDDDNGAGLLLDTTYSYFAVRVDSLGQWKDTSSTVTAKTLAPTSHQYSWQEFTIGDPGFSNALYDVWGTDENNVWACGTVSINDTTYGVLKWNGIEWIPEKRIGGLQAIYGFSNSDIWAVGGAIVRYEGNVWTDITNTDPVLHDNQSYTSLWGTSSSNMYLGNQWGKIIHWDGQKAEIVYQNNNYVIADIYGTDNNNLWAVGGEQGGDFSDLFLYFNGNQWVEDNSIVFDHFTPSSIMSFSVKENYIVGAEILFGERNKWVLMDDPAIEYMHKIRGNKQNNLFVCGAYNLIMHYNGYDWYGYDDIKTPLGGVLYSIVVFQNVVFAVGIDETFSRAKILTGAKN